MDANQNNHNPLLINNNKIQQIIPRTYQEQSDFKTHFFQWLYDKNYNFELGR